ncbi:MAG: alpha/beta hydrolase-fold protein, partial [Flavobacteriaceae bacterium]|nr:alpha/beta hydrolase-fold protein [Flavobacteriaceae bacterium]
MKLKLIILFTLLINNFSFTQTSIIIETLKIESKILNSTRNFAVYLPPDYNTSIRSYPVLYLLHGYTDDHTGWIQFGEVKHITDKAISEGKATPMIIVMPDADTNIPGYFNTIDNSWRYEDFFFDELMLYVENLYRIKKEKRYRAISGLSMGGGGTMVYALHRPDLFTAACPLSAWLGPLSIEELKKSLNNNKGILKVQSKKDYTENQLKMYYNKHNPLELLNTVSKSKINSVRWYIDCGDDDFL